MNPYTPPEAKLVATEEDRSILPQNSSKAVAALVAVLCIAWSTTMILQRTLWLDTDAYAMAAILGLNAAVLFVGIVRYKKLSYRVSWIAALILLSICGYLAFQLYWPYVPTGYF